MGLFNLKVSDKNHFVEIDGIRGICAILLLVYHYTSYIYGMKGEHDWFLDMMDYGKYGVHFFFVISGFLIFMTLEKAKQPRDFIISRFSRLYPGYWVCMTLTTLVVGLSAFYNYHPVTTSRFLANLTMFQHWMSIEDIDGVYWTLAVELCFYVLIFSVFVFKQQKNIERIGVIWLILMVAVFYLEKYKVLPEINFYYYLPLLRNGTLFFGGILFYQLKNNNTDKRKYILLLLTLIVHFIINSTEETIVILLVYIILFLFVINKLKFMRGKFFYFIGIISYALYLLHQYIGYEIINYLNSFGITNMLLLIIITGLLIVILASLVAFGVERPMMRLIRGRYKGMSAKN